MNKASKILSLFCEEPYRLFFPLGILIGVIGAGHWLAYAFHWTSSYSGFFHASIQTEGYMACFVVGFLTTAIPRFSSTPHASVKELTVFFLLMCAVVGFLLFHLWVAAEICFILWLLKLAFFIGTRLRKKILAMETTTAGPSSPPPLEFVWIPFAILMGLVGSILLILSQCHLVPAWAADLGEDMTQQGFVLAIVAGVGGFLAPRLMGRYQMVKPSEVCTMEELAQSKRRRILIHFGAGTLFFLSFLLDMPDFQILANGLRALVVSSILVWTRTLPLPPRSPGLFVKLLWFSMWMVAVGLWFAALFPAYEKTALHFTFLGGLSLMTFAVATMVVLSHGGEAAKLQKSLWVLRIVGCGVLLALGFRVAAVFFPQAYFQTLAVAAAFWILAGTTWLCFIAPRILRIPAAGEFERQHEQMKERVVRLET